MAYRIFATYEQVIDGIPVIVKRKNIRNIYLKVDRHTGQVSVSTPLLVRRKKIEEFVRKYHAWIRKSQRAKSRLPDSLRDPVSWVEGDTISVFAKKLELRVFSGVQKKGIYTSGRELHVCTGRTLKPETLTKKVDDWLRKELSSQVIKLVSRYEPLMGVKVSQVRTRRMKTRWGTCNIRARRIWLNTQLIHLKPEFTELVVVHEMVHLLEASHNKRFYSLMEQYLPGFKETEDMLKGKIH